VIGAKNAGQKFSNADLKLLFTRLT
jgi:hypothetical protein